jgi:protein KRI1
MSSRKKIREAERQRKEEEKKERDTEKNRLRKLKTEELQNKVKQIKAVAGLRASEFTDDDWARFLDDAWDDKQWETEMQKRFGEEYYAEDDGDSGTEGKKKHPKKPTWDDDIDIKDLVPDFEDEELGPALDSSDEGENDDEPSKKKSKAQEKRDQKREARKDRLRIEEAVDRNLDLDITLLPGATKKNATRFRYRETSPQSFGLTARDILMADDTQLNQFAGLKKLASFRDEEKKVRDQRKLGKKARLRQWRKDTFGNEEGPSFKFGGDAPGPSSAEQGDDKEGKVDIREGDGRRKKRKRSKKH